MCLHHDLIFLVTTFIFRNMSHVSFQTRVHVVSVLKQGSLFDLTMKIILAFLIIRCSQFWIIISITWNQWETFFLPNKVKGKEMLRYITILVYIQYFTEQMFKKYIAIESKIRWMLIYLNVGINTSTKH